MKDTFACQKVVRVATHGCVGETDIICGKPKDHHIHGDATSVADHEYTPSYREQQTTVATDDDFDVEKLHPNFRRGVKRMVTPAGVEFAGTGFYSRNECEDVIWIRTSQPVMVTSTFDEYGNPSISFADVTLHGHGEDGDEGKIAVQFPGGTKTV